MESCRLAGERGQVAYDAIQKRQDCSASTKVRAKLCLDSLQQRARAAQIENSCVTLHSASSSSSNTPDHVAQERRMLPLTIYGSRSSHSRTDDLFNASTSRVATLPLRNYVSSQASARSKGTLNVEADRVEAAPTRTLRDRFNLHDRQNGNHPQSARFAPAMAGGVYMPHVVSPCNNMPGYSRYAAQHMTPAVVIEKFDGNVLRFPEFNRKFFKFVDAVYDDFDIRLSHLEALCVGEARNVIEGLSANPNRKYAYEMAWRRLEDRFGDPTALIRKVLNELQ